MIQHKFNKFQKYVAPQRTNFNLVKPPFRPSLSQSNIICHYCGILGHEASNCQKKKRQQALAQNQSNNFTKDKNHIYALNTIFSNPKVSLVWILDCGASQHMTSSKSLFHDYHELPTFKTILLGDNNFYKATGYGLVLFKLKTRELLLLTNILHIPGLAKHLLSIVQVSANNTIITFKNDQAIITTNSMLSIRLIIPKKDNLYPLDIGVEPTSLNFNITIKSNPNLESLCSHYCIGHLKAQYLRIMQIVNLVIRLPPINLYFNLCNCRSTQNPSIPLWH